MKFLARYTCAALLAAVPACLAQKWEIGGVAGGGFSNNLTVSNAIGSALTGFKTGPAFGGVLGHNLYRYVSGELRYTYLQSDLKLSGSGTETSFSGIAHAIHYDLLIHTKPLRSHVRPFAAAGGGVKVFRGTGRESAFQPLSTFALLTKTREWKPLISVGGGTKFAIAPRVTLRVEVRDYITPFPKQVITPAPGAKLSGWLHDFVPMFGFVYTF